MPDPVVASAASWVATAWGAVGGVVSGGLSSYLGGIYQARQAAKDGIEELGHELQAQVGRYWRRDGKDDATEQEMTLQTQRFQVKANAFARRYLQPTDRTVMASKLMTILTTCTGGTFGTTERKADPQRIALLSVGLQKIYSALDAQVVRSVARRAFRLSR